jgi:hypothetical protein
MKRIVTGHDRSGKPVFVSEGEPPKQVSHGASGAPDHRDLENGRCARGPCAVRRSDDRPSPGRRTLPADCGGGAGGRGRRRRVTEK